MLVSRYSVSHGERLPYTVERASGFWFWIYLGQGRSRRVELEHL